MIKNILLKILYIEKLLLDFPVENEKSIWYLKELKNYILENLGVENLENEILEG